MTPFEYLYRSLMPFLPPLHGSVRRRLLEILDGMKLNERARVLDVGGRKSHYTIGVPADVTITDLPRESDVQIRLNLGVTTGIVAQTKRRRSNVCEVVLDDMTKSCLPDSSFHCVLAVEVLEHVEADEEFVHQVHRVLKPGGVFLMTTPNGDFVPNRNPDHKRHYRRQELQGLLENTFENAHIEYAIRTGRYRRAGLRSWSLRRPLLTAFSAVANVINAWESRSSSLARECQGTHHLIAVAKKAG